MYTSGSTGRPKGVKISHHCVTNLVIQEKLVNWNKCDAILSLSTFAFDASVFDIFASLTQGKALLIVSDFDRLDFSQWNVTCRDFQSVICFVTTALFNRVSTLGQIWPANIVQVLFGGEQADLYAINQFKKSNPQSRLVHVYGPTETTVFATFCEIKGDVYDAPIGLPLSNVTGKIVDSLNAPCCHGAIGELLIGGKQLAKGYLNQAQNTADKFIFAESDGRRYYRTGDLVKLNAQNLIEYVGRTDSQIKLRGYRIELEEVEAAINSLDFVKSTAVVVSKNGGEAKLEAYLVLSTAEIEEDVVLQLTDSIKERLPEYMLPDLFFVVSELPLSANGKVDKIRLRTSQKQLLKSGVEHILPSSRAQQKLACIWAEILKLDVANIGLKDSFLNLGANSLHFVTLAAKIREQFEVEVAVSDIFSALELEKMTGLALGKKNTVQHALPPILSGESEQTAPLSFSQKRLWLASQLNESATQYNIVMAHKITGTFDINAAEQAFNQIIERHHVLRSVLVLENGEPVQRVVNDWKFNFEQVDLSDAYLSMGDEAISAFTQEFGHREFVFTRDLMLKAAIAKLGPSGDLALIVNVHHIATDGWSMNILIDEFSSFYEATINQKAADLEPLPLQYHDYAKWQHSEELIAVINEQKEFWSSNLEGAPEIHHLPLDFERPSMPDFEAGLHTKLISEELSQKANEMMAQYEVTDFMLFHSVFTLLLAKLSDCDDIIIGTPLANRVQNELSGLIGFFVNSLPLRVKVEQQQSFLTLLDSVKQTNVAVQSNQLLPFEQLVELIAPERNSAYSPVFQIEMNMNNTESTTEFNFVEQNLSLLRLENTSRQSHLDLVLSLVKQGQQYAVNFTFSSALFNHNTIVDMADCFVYLLEQVMLQPQQTLAKVSLLTEQQQASYYAENLARTLDIGEIRGVEQLFERQAKSHSERTAITMQCDKISYGELNTKSNQLAHGLIDKGVKAETIVAICMERSINSAVAMLGVLKAGGAYVYIEPNTPSERIEQILEQAAATIVLTEQEFMSVLSFDMELTMLLMDDNWFEALFGSLPSLTPDVEVSANNLMYVVFTSGSTGEPKGVMIERGSYVETIMEHINFLKINQSSKTLQCASLSFDAGPFHLFYGLCGGANVHMVTIDSQFSSYVDEHQLTHLAMPAAVFNSMAKSPLESVKVITFGGESPTKEAVAYWSQHCKLVNLYGPSEASVMVSRKVLSANQPITIGRAVSGAALYVLDPSLNPVPSGVRGELFIAGRALARGYLNNEPLTQEKFIDVTSLPIPGNRLYRTGDKAYVNADKDIVFVGRDDNQVKIRGYRIELSEITSKLLEIDEVKEAITLVETSESGEKRIVAYVCCGADVFVEPTDAQVNTLLRKQLKETLPAYMVPSVVKRLSVMPLNNSGKIDKQALPEIDFSDFKVSYQAAVSEQEQVLVAIWAELLEQNKDSISVLANFFEIGGHSLLAIKMVSLIAARLNVELDVGEVLQSNDLAILAELIANKQQEQKLKAALHQEQKGNEFEYEL
ncbi:amino acid adenylation domain-containing protein [Pseudoalteromonas sp. 2CM41L]|nr:amino acid adenylation domain-containing protein [Pseudoalteromonas sp. 2CM41L]